MFTAYCFVMNLVIDVGNTLVKLAVFHNDSVFEKITVKHNEIVSATTSILEKYPIISRGIISSVGKLNAEAIESIQSKIDLLLAMEHQLGIFGLVVSLLNHR